MTQGKLNPVATTQKTRHSFLNRSLCSMHEGTVKAIYKAITLIHNTLTVFHTLKLRRRVTHILEVYTRQNCTKYIESKQVMEWVCGGSHPLRTKPPYGTMQWSFLLESLEHG